MTAPQSPDIAELASALDAYAELAMRTAKTMPDPAGELVHAALGLAGEAGEFADAIKRHVTYGQRLDVANSLEELGDLLWYVALAARAIGVPLSHIAQHNIDKLRRRYPHRYTDALAALRFDKEQA
jgi:NTP pyrophosphatase (non-canonical NTP hydrolase)